MDSRIILTKLISKYPPDIGKIAPAPAPAPAPASAPASASNSALDFAPAPVSSLASFPAPAHNPALAPSPAPSNPIPFVAEASVLLKILRGHWKAYLIEKPSLELCRHLVMLRWKSLTPSSGKVMKINVYYMGTSCIIPRDYNISGRINLMEIPVLLHMLHFWKVRYIFIYSLYIQVLIAHAILTFTYLVVTPIPILSLLWTVFPERIPEVWQASLRQDIQVFAWICMFYHCFIFCPQLQLAPNSLGSRSQCLK